MPMYKFRLNTVKTTEEGKRLHDYFTALREKKLAVDCLRLNTGTGGKFPFFFVGGDSIVALECARSTKLFGGAKLGSLLGRAAAILPSPTSVWPLKYLSERFNHNMIGVSFDLDGEALVLLDGDSGTEIEGFVPLSTEDFKAWMDPRSTIKLPKCKLTDVLSQLFGLDLYFMEFQKSTAYEVAGMLEFFGSNFDGSRRTKDFFHEYMTSAINEYESRYVILDGQYNVRCVFSHSAFYRYMAPLPEENVDDNNDGDCQK